MQRVKGTVIKSRLAFVTEHGGMDALERVLARFSAEDRKTLERVITVGWYPFALGKQLDDAIVAVVGGGDPGVFRRLGRASADTNLSTVHRTFISAGDPHAFLGRAQQIYALYYDTGRREYERTGDRSGVLTTRDAETFSAPDCQTVMGWYERALEMCGAKHPSLEEEECRARGGTVCRYRVTWE